VFRMTMLQGNDITRGGVAGATADSQANGGANTLAAAGGPFLNTEGAGNTSVRTGGAGATLSVSVVGASSVDEPITWSTTSKLVSLSATTGKSIVVTGNNAGNRAEYATVKAAAADGFYVVSHVKVEPAYVDPPVFVSAPVMGVPEGGKVSVAYTLKLNGRDDQSPITWYQCDDAACAMRRKVAVSRGDVPLLEYTLGAGDVGKYIEAVIEPKLNISEPGPAETVIAAKPVTEAEAATKTVSPEFRNFVETENKAYVNGMWTVLGTWTSSTSEDLMHGYGLRVNSQGAALLYQNDAKTDEMQVKVVLTPEKTQGQGFGIAGVPDDSAGERNQKADIYIKYDPRTQNGYSLRFWRTIQSAEKCMFQLYQVVDGVGHPVSEVQQLTGVFKPSTTIALAYANGVLTAKGSNTADTETLSLNAKVDANTFGGAGVKWTGSVPFGNSVVVSQFQITFR
jgi:hypothetical protein